MKNTLNKVIATLAIAWMTAIAPATAQKATSIKNSKTESANILWAKTITEKYKITKALKWKFFLWIDEKWKEAVIDWNTWKIHFYMSAKEKIWAKNDRIISWNWAEMEWVTLLDNNWLFIERFDDWSAPEDNTEKWKKLAKEIKEHNLKENQKHFDERVRSVVYEKFNWNTKVWDVIERKAEILKQIKWQFYLIQVDWKKSYCIIKDPKKILAQTLAHDSEEYNEWDKVLFYWKDWKETKDNNFAYIWIIWEKYDGRLIDLKTGNEMSTKIRDPKKLWQVYKDML